MRTSRFHSSLDSKMAGKDKTQYVCQQCGHKHAKWAGRCQDCGAWNAIVEERVPGGFRRTNTTTVVASENPVPITEIATLDIPRYKSELTELDNVLGGGLVPGSVVLLGGEPGVGKS